MSQIGRSSRNVDRSTLAMGVVAATLSMAMVGCSSSPQLTSLEPATRPAESRLAADPGLITQEPTLTAGPPFPPDALSQMELAFIGNPSQSEVLALLEQAFEIYDLDLTEENMSRAGSTLVALRLDAENAGRSDITEMALLEAMVDDGGLPGMTFPEAAGWVSAVLRLDP